MTTRFICWAQALDNASPDHIEVHGTVLSPEETARRQDAVSVVSNVVKSGSRLLDERGVRFTEDGSHFVAEVPSAERDQVGRVAPVVCCGAYESTFGKELGVSVASELDGFAKRIGRTILSEHLELVGMAFEILKKKSSKKRLARSLAIGAFALAVAALAWWLVSRTS